MLTVVAACGSKTEQTSAPAAGDDPAATAAAPSPAPIVPAPAVTQASWAPDALEELLAPIALYPDALLAQILAASINGQEVLDAGNWLLQNQTLTGDALDAAAQKAGFGPATRALVQFPTVVDMMCQQIDWTRQLGSAFTSDQKSVLDAVQRLRAQAVQVGNLQSTPQQKVETKKESDKVIVEVKPADPKVVYVPQYDPQQVYTTPAPPPSSSGTVDTGTAVAGALLAFGVGVALGHALDDNDCYPHWSSGVVFYGPRPFYPPAYVYRPVYGPAFHPAYRYAPPPGYRHSYNNVNVNVNRNIVVNNNNYYNRFNNNQNLRVDAPNRPEDWRGQSTYAGTRNETRAAAQARDNQTSTQHVKPDRAQHVDRGYGESTRVASLDTAAPSRPEVVRQDSQQNAFSGAAREGNGSLERAASARGRASAGEHSAHVAHAGRRR
ncbi:MAG TPA: DUF3300 domain-containing protein [Steroidobacteraceae bacterium]|nr:DUF3300 domain-containing protein [Steroidobacteraceae bacterium]